MTHLQQLSKPFCFFHSLLFGDRSSQVIKDNFRVVLPGIQYEVETLLCTLTVQGRFCSLQLTLALPSLIHVREERKGGHCTWAEDRQHPASEQSIQHPTLQQHLGPQCNRQCAGCISRMPEFIQAVIWTITPTPGPLSLMDRQCW